MTLRRVRYLPVSVGLGVFLAVSYLACTIWDGLFSSQAMHGAWETLLPGFTWWSWGSFFLGLVETFAYGFWLGLAVPIVRWAHRWLTPHLENAGAPVLRATERAS